MQAVRLMITTSKPAADILRELVVRRDQLSSLQEQLRAKGKNAFTGKGYRTEKDDEIAPLKRELAPAKEERDICLSTFHIENTVKN